MMIKDTLTKLTYKTKGSVNIEEEAKGKRNQLGDCIYKEMSFSGYPTILFNSNEKCWQYKRYC